MVRNGLGGIKHVYKTSHINLFLLITYFCVNKKVPHCHTCCLYLNTNYLLVGEYLKRVLEYYILSVNNPKKNGNVLIFYVTLCRYLVKINL